MRDASEAMEAAAKMAELTKANALLLAEIQRATVERDALRAGTPGGPGGTKALLAVAPPPDTPGTEISTDDDVAPGDAEMLQAGGDNSLSRMTGYVVTAVMLILTMVALAGSVSCVAIAVGMSKIVGHASYAVLHVGSLRKSRLMDQVVMSICRESRTCVSGCTRILFCLLLSQSSLSSLHVTSTRWRWEIFGESDVSSAPWRHMRRGMLVSSSRSSSSDLCYPERMLIQTQRLCNFKNLLPVTRTNPW